MQTFEPYNPDDFGASVKFSNRVFLAMSSFSNGFETWVRKLDLTKISGYESLSEKYPEYDLAANMNELFEAHSQLEKIKKEQVTSAFFQNSYSDLVPEETKIRARIAKLNQSIEAALKEIEEREESLHDKSKQDPGFKLIKKAIRNQVKVYRESDIIPIVPDGETLSKTDMKVYFILKFWGETTPINKKKIKKYWTDLKDLNLSISIRAISNSIKKLQKLGYIQVMTLPGCHVKDRATSHVVFCDQDMNNTAEYGGLGFTCLTMEHLKMIMKCESANTLRMLLRIMYEVSLDIYTKKYADVQRVGEEVVYTHDVSEALKFVHVSHSESFDKQIKELSQIGFGEISIEQKPTRWENGIYNIHVFESNLPKVNEFKTNVYNPKIGSVIHEIYNAVERDAKTGTNIFYHGKDNMRLWIARPDENGILALPKGAKEKGSLIKSVLESIYNTVGFNYLRQSLYILLTKYGREMDRLADVPRGSNKWNEVTLLGGKLVSIAQDLKREHLSTVPLT